MHAPTMPFHLLPPNLCHLPPLPHPSPPHSSSAPAERPAAYRQALELADHIEARGIEADIQAGTLRIFFPYRRPPQPQLLRPQGPRRVIIQATPGTALAPAASMMRALPASQALGSTSRPGPV